MNIEISEIKKAAERLENVRMLTPVVYSNFFSDFTGGKIYLKYENLQKTGSFKIRGAANKISKLIEEKDMSPVVTASSGNHAQGVAYAAKKLGLKATVVMSKNASIAKVEAAKNYGADVVLYGDCYDDAYQKGREIAEKENARFIHPFNDPDVIAGQGTIGLEIMKALPDTDIIIVPVGGGGLISGVASAAKQINPDVKVYGVQAENANAAARSFREKKKTSTETAETIADGIAVKSPGDITFALIEKYVDGIVTVTDTEISDAVLLLIERCKQVVEPAGATPIAAIMNGKIDVKGKNVVCLTSGGNIDVTLIGKFISRGLAARGRTAQIYAIIPDKPDAISLLLDTITENRGFIEEFARIATSLFIPPNQSCYYIQFGTVDNAHKDLIVDKLKEKGIEIIDTDMFVDAYGNEKGKETK